jgi:hypothetical protein
MAAAIQKAVVQYGAKQAARLFAQFRLSAGLADVAKATPSAFAKWLLLHLHVAHRMR